MLASPIPIVVVNCYFCPMLFRLHQPALPERHSLLGEHLPRFSGE